MSSHAILSTVCRVCRPFAANACDTSLPFAEKCHGYIYIPGSTAKGITALGKGSKVGYGLPRNNATSQRIKNYLAIGTANAANEARHVWRRRERAQLATSAAQALANVNALQRKKQNEPFTKFHRATLAQMCYNLPKHSRRRGG